MAKGKKGKGKGKGKKKAPKIDPNALTEVDKTFYELTITDLNRKLARLRSLTTELEEKNEELKNDLQKLDEDRNDIIIYLKRMLQEKSDEIAELQERLKALEETRQDETEQYEAKISDLENEYKQMHEQLTSEIKLLEGKLNSLEEFRIQRDELMKKFEDQENAMEEQEKRHKLELYEIERKFIIGKDKLKKDMEARLLQLSSEFQDATELRIAATTHRVIRENIAINNELDLMLTTHEKLNAENFQMKERDKKLKLEAELHEAEKKKILAKVRVQMNIINQLTQGHEEMSRKLEKYKTIEQEIHQTYSELQTSKQTITCLYHQIRILEQNLHAIKCKEVSMQTELNSLHDDNDRLTAVLREAVYAVKEVLELKTKISDPALKVSKREGLLTQLFTLLSEAEKGKARKASLETVGSLSATYERGDLGFVPKAAVKRSIIPTIRHIEAQTGHSFEEFLAIGQSEDLLQKPEGSFVSSDVESEGIENGEAEEQSDVFFNEEEDLQEESVFELEGSGSFTEDESEAIQRKKSARAVTEHKTPAEKSEHIIKQDEKAAKGSNEKEHSKKGSVEKVSSKGSTGKGLQKETTGSVGKEAVKLSSIKEVERSSSVKVLSSGVPTKDDTTDDATTLGSSPLPEDSKCLKPRLVIYNYLTVVSP